MYALGIFGYLLGCLVVAGVLTIITSLFRKVENNDGFKSWRKMGFFGVVVAVLPYTYHAYLTNNYGAGMDKPVEKALKSAGVTGSLAYYKVTGATDTTAELLVVAKEKTTLNAGESCVMSMNLVKDARKGWKVQEYKFIDSFKRNVDGFTFPPYW